MTAVMHTPTVTAAITTTEVDVLDASSILMAGLEDFLKDPISYGSYDFTDPMSLDEFSSARHFRGAFAAPLS